MCVCRITALTKLIRTILITTKSLFEFDGIPTTVLTTKPSWSKLFIRHYRSKYCQRKPNIKESNRVSVENHKKE